MQDLRGDTRRQKMKDFVHGQSFLQQLSVCWTLTVSQALVEAKLNDMYRNIREATRGLAFFATPHRGGNYAKLGDIAAKIARTVLKNQPNTFLDSLQKDSLFSEDLQDDFRHQVENYSILSFFETRPMDNIGVVRLR